MTTTIIVHDDMDGAASAAVANMLIEGEKKTVFCSYDTIDYYVNEAVYKSTEKDFIVIADICPPEKELARLHATATDVLLVDHHETRAPLYEKYTWAKYYEELCGAFGLYKELLDMDYEFPGGVEDSDKFRHFLSAVDAYDCWKVDSPYRQRGLNLNKMCYFIGVEDFANIAADTLGDFESMKLSFNDIMLFLIKDQDRYIKKALRHLRKATDEQHRVGLIYAEQHRSELAHVILERNTELDYTLIVDLYRDTMSLRSVKSVNVAEIAEKWGGGGHYHASGISFVNEKFLETLK